MLAPKTPLFAQPFGIPTTQGDDIPTSSPFRIYVEQQRPKLLYSVSKYSCVLKSIDITDKLDIIGLDVPIDFKYSDKFWLEIFYDKNLTPIFGLINEDAKWRAKIKSGAKDVDVYPNQLEFISKSDISNKIQDLQDTIDDINNFKAKVLDKLNSDKLAGFISTEEYTDLLKDTNDTYKRVTDGANQLKASMNNFFASAPTASYKKLFRSYTLIGYTTKDFNTKLDGINVSPNATAPTTNTSVPQSSNNPDFRIIQCLNSDLILADICFENRYPAKLPIPYHRPILDFWIDGQLEEDINTDNLS